MDPDKALADIRELVAQAHNGESQGIDYLLSSVQELAEKVEDLDTWISTGGFLPLAWQNFGGQKTPEEPKSQPMGCPRQRPCWRAERPAPTCGVCIEKGRT